MELTETRILCPSEIGEAVRLLAEGRVVAFPTETVYGLGANALNPEAVKAIFKAKGRPQDNPLIIHLSEAGQVEPFVQEVPFQARLLMEEFWPGPLTLVLKKTEQVPEIVTAGLDTVAVRVPDHAVALELLKHTGFPVAAPSANVSGRPSPTRAQHVLADLGGLIPAILDGGETGWGLESTVLDCTATPFRLLRPGGVTLEDLRTLVPVQYGASQIDLEDQEAPRSPGMKYQHYAPDAEVYLVTGDGVATKIRELSEPYIQRGEGVGVMTWKERADLYPTLTVLDMGPQGDFGVLAHSLYHLLREADVLGLKVLFIEGVSEDNLGLAIMNRLRKAADHREIKT
ncbi:MAG TPA: L-threonylcarbamoyladenylate synthase [Limnochordia bacterium]|nr:L-threonylcarbamoyladenylate synthase [Limnochordia bacterium]